MKKYLCFLVLLLDFISSRAQNCNIGNEDTTGYDNGGLPFWSNNLLGSSFSLAAPGTLQSINLIALGSGALVQMAVYDDNIGVPGNLISASGVDTITPGIVSLPVTPVQLNPGVYWVMAIYSTDEYTICNNTSGSNSIYYTSMAFGIPPPLTATGFSSYVGPDIAYFLEITCLNTGENSIHAGSTINVYPNPASEYIYVSASDHARQYFITNVYGQIIEQGTLQNNNAQIAIQHLSSGIYFIDLGDNRKLKFIKD